MLASSGGHIEIVRELLKHESINVHAKNNDGITSFITACAGGHLDVICELLKQKNLIASAKCNGGMTSLMMASVHGVGLFATPHHRRR
jgi:ankyrin repeat protein